MSEALTVEKVSAGPKLPPTPPNPLRPLAGLAFMVKRRPVVARLNRSYGRCFSLKVPVFGETVVVSDPALAKQIFTTSPDVLYNIQPNLSRLLGSGSVFALDGNEHRMRRKLLTPPFHGKSIKAYERIVEEETEREMASWPQGQRVRDARADDAHHPQRHPARDLRRRRRGVAAAARPDPDLGDPRVAAGRAAVTEAAVAVDAVGQARGVPPRRTRHWSTP